MEEKKNIKIFEKPIGVVVSDEMRGIISIASWRRSSPGYFPELGRKVTVVDKDDGEEISLRIHRGQYRIDGFLSLLNKHDVKRGDTITVEIDPDNIYRMVVGFYKKEGVK